MVWYNLVYIGSGNGLCLMAPSHCLNQCWLVIREVQWQSPEANFITHWYPSHQAPKFVWKLLLKFHSYLQETKKLLSWMILVLFAARPVFRLYGLCDPRNHQTTGCAAQVIPYPPCHSTSRQTSRQLLISSAAFLGCFSAIFKVSYTWNLELLKVTCKQVK